jgi:hypothetical protein
LVDGIRKEQAEIVQSLESKLQHINGNADNDGARSNSEKKMEKLLQQLEAKIKQLGHVNSQTLIKNSTSTVDNDDSNTPNTDRTSRISPIMRLMTDRIADLPSAILQIDQKGQYVASPSILILPSGRLLVALEISIPRFTPHVASTLIKHIYASDDGGKSWIEIATMGPMNWPQLFACKSGIYIIGTQSHFSKDNNLLISKMMDTEGEQWSKPVKISNGLSVIAANTGVDVSHGRVTKTFEIIPSMAEPVPTTVVVDGMDVEIEGGVGGATWSNPPVYEVKVEDSSPFVEYCLIKIVFTMTTTTTSTATGETGMQSKVLFFRILKKAGPPSNNLTLRLERFNLFFQTESISIPPNAKLVPGSSSDIYGGVDWVASAINADENDDLTDPQAWTFLSPAIGNPASIYSNEFRELFDAAFRPDAALRNGILGFDLGKLQEEPIDQETALEAGFGSLYWMEGVVVRQQDRHGSNGRLLSIMRVNNDLACDLAAVLEFDDSQPGRLVGRFLRYTFVPGLGVSHPAIVYDIETDLYWMATNVNRDATRGWKQPDQPNDMNPSLQIGPSSACQVDRTTLGLFYSTNLFNWITAGVVDYHITFGRHFSYPHMAIDGEDLIIVSRATIIPGERESTLRSFYNNHNANAVSFHRVERFRELANVKWATYQGQYSAEKRRVAIASWNP